MRSLQNLLVTGGAGFIGSNFIRRLLKTEDFTGRIINIDKLTYAGNLENLFDVEGSYGGSRYFFERVDICDIEAIRSVFERYQIDTVVHFAAESHVDRSIFGPREFLETNIMGTFSVLECAREFWKGREDVLFHHVSTDEVYGSLGDSGYFYEHTPYDPRSPYSASKASSDHLMIAYHHTYGLPVTISNCSNNYGPYQFPEKLIPLMIDNIVGERPLPVYGDGKNVRDWVYVDDHNEAVWLIMKGGRLGETYNIGGENEWENIKLINAMCEKIAGLHDRPLDYYKKLITFVKDRPGHDRRYAINCDKLKNELKWTRRMDFDRGLDATIAWYLKNREWVERVKSGEYRKWIAKNYEER